jgi:hypothetical protein
MPPRSLASPNFFPSDFACGDRDWFEVDRDRFESDGRQCSPVREGPADLTPRI